MKSYMKIKIADLLRRRKPNRADVSKRIMPNKCRMCHIGVGKSMLFYEGTWRPFKHIENKMRYFYYDGGKIKVCDDCYERLTEMEKPSGYIKDNIFEKERKWKKK